MTFREREAPAGWYLCWVISGGALYAVLGVAVFILVVLAFVGVSSWLDRRFSTTPEEVAEDIDQYGAAAGGIRSELLPEEQRAEVLAERKADRVSRTPWHQRLFRR